MGSSQRMISHRLSRLFQPVKSVPPGAKIKHNDQENLSKSYKLMTEEGIISPSHNGYFYLLPLGVKALDKFIKLVESHMSSIGAQKMSCPTLTSAHLWHSTGRLSLAGPELLHLKDRHGKDFILSPTHEESISQLLASQQPLSHKQLPLMLYQTSNKFRDEMKPRFGLIRAREFLMKDLYSFDSTTEAAKDSYDIVTQAYDRILKKIGVSFIKVKGPSGMMGGKESHEFHLPSAIGDDTLRLCQGCGHGWNAETNETGPCEQCGATTVSHTKGIEVGHAFMLGTKYSEPLKALYTNSQGKSLPLVMGSYGLGLTRLLAASLEVLSTADNLRWPSALAPYSLCIITPKEGSKESAAVGGLSEELYWRLQGVGGLEEEVLLDDRAHLSIGRRLRAARRAGHPRTVVVGRDAASDCPRLELHDATGAPPTLLSPSDLVNTLAQSLRLPDAHTREPAPLMAVT